MIIGFGVQTRIIRVLGKLASDMSWGVRIGGKAAKGGGWLLYTADAAADP